MKRYGGSFVMRLGDAALYADTENLQIIKTAFPVIWQHYSDAAKQDLIQFVAAELHRVNFGNSQPKDNDCGGYYCSEEHGHIDCKKPVFQHCNVCGCVLRGDSEFAMGMCTAHANEGLAP